MNINQVKILKLKYIVEDNGSLVIIERTKDLPFTIARVFSVQAPAGSIRGQHAHKKCTQFLTCPIGEIEVICEDGKESVKFILDNPKKGILIPPGIWAEQNYRTSNSLLNVICDLDYDPNDYIRSYSEYKSFIQAKKI